MDKPMQVIRVIEAAVGTSRILGEKAMVMRGKLTPDQFPKLTVPDYQRLVMNGRKADELDEVMGEDGDGVPDDIIVCVRHENYRAEGGNEFEIPLADGAFILDGHQRYAATMRLRGLGRFADDLGVKIIFGTTLEDEIQIFHQLNREQTKVSTHLLLRNLGTNAAIEALRELEASDPKFPSVQWDQRKQPGQVITAHMLFELACILHGRRRDGEIEDLIVGLEESTNLVGTELLVKNVRYFFEVVHKCFGEGKREGGEIHANEKKKYMYRISLLQALATVFARHEDFWAPRKPYELKLRVEDLRKLRSLPPRTVERGIARSNAATELIDDITRYMNSARERKLTLRDRDVWFPTDAE